jgi:hypothetical protein
VNELQTGGRDGRPSPTRIATRIATWIAVGSIGIFLLASGVVGIIAKG